MLNLDSILPVQSPLTFDSFEFKGDFSLPLQAPKHKPTLIPLPEDPHILGYNYSVGEVEQTKVFDFEPRTYREHRRRPLNLDFDDIFGLANLFPDLHVQQLDDEVPETQEETELEQEEPVPEEPVPEPEEPVPESEEPAQQE